MQDILENLDIETKVAVVQMLNDEYTREIIEAETRQEEIARVNHQLGPRHAVDGLGEQTMSVDPGLYWAHRIRNKRNWNDKDWREWMLRHNPELRVKTLPAKIRVGPTQFSQPVILAERGFGAGTSRFHKRYVE